MMIGLPLVVVMLPLMCLVLTHVFPIHIDALPGGAEIINDEMSKLGEMPSAEKRVAMVFGTAAALWIFRPLLSTVIPQISDAGIAVAVSLALFIIPAGKEENRRLLNWDEAETLPWGVLLIFGGGLSLASAIKGTGLAAWIGEGVGHLAGWPAFLIALFAVTMIVFLTEVTSNTATTATFLRSWAQSPLGSGRIRFSLPCLPRWP